MQSVDTILGSVIGRPFEFECSEIVVKGRRDFEKPLFRGPGTISGGIDGQIAFRLFDQSPKPEENLRRILQSINSQELLRFSGTDSHMTEWTGAWFVPDVRFPDSGGRPVVFGKVSSIGARLPLGFRTHWKNSTGLYYAEKLPLPMQSVTETHVLRGSEVVSKRSNADHAKISDGDLSIDFQEDLTSGFTEVIAQNRPKLQPPFAEIGLCDAVVYLLCRICLPRAVVRFFDTDAQIFVRECDTNARTSLPDPIRGQERQSVFCWEIFRAFLRQYYGQESVSSVPIAQGVYEVIRSSNGTLHGFVVSLLLTIEKLFTGLADAPSLDSKKSFGALREHVEAWPGDQEIKQRALGLLGGLNHPSPTSILRKLKDDGVVTGDEAESWKSVRPKIAHGALVDVSDEGVWVLRGRLITMFHRLILRTIGYRGRISDFSGSQLQGVDFEWKESENSGRLQ